MLVRTIPTPLTRESPLILTASPLTRDAFAAFGDVIANPRPECRPSNTSPEAISRGLLPCGAVSVNQGTAIQYRGITTTSTPRDLYASAPSGKKATARTTMFVSGARMLVSSPKKGGVEGKKEVGGSVEVQVLERHPFTSQTFIPLTADKSKRYLVIVAPTLDTITAEDEKLPMPTPTSPPTKDGTRLPGPGLPDLTRLKTFVVTGEQAVTYAPGTWHAPMIALGPPGSSIDFVVVQFANDVPVEDCQEVALDNAKGAAGIFVRIPESRVISKL